MGRALKFRTWDKSNLCMEPARDLYFFEELGIRETNDEHNQYEVMQFTGLLDRNGKEIYEGDTVIWDGGQYTIVFSSHDGSWILKDDRDDWSCPSLYGVSSPRQSRIEIIGNIYEGRKT